MKLTKKTCGTFLLLFILTALPMQASLNVNTAAVNKSVVYIYGGDSTGHADPARPLGTGFLISVPLLTDEKRAYVLLVTARHIVDPAWAHCPDSQPQLIYLRLNTKTYEPKAAAVGVGFVPLALTQNGQPAWWHHTDDAVDVAVFLLNPKAFDDYDIGEIGLSDFATEEEAKQRVPTDPVISAGLLLGYSGAKRNYPVLKFGHISTKPDEEISTPCVKDGGTTPMHLWLLSINLMPGSSGSPIFYVPEGANNVSFGGGRTTLIGLQSISYFGFDVSGMTPAEYIVETIERMKLTDADLYRGPLEKRPGAVNPGTP